MRRMTRQLRRGDRLVVASHNPGKVREIEALLAPYGVAAVAATALGLPEPEETGGSFIDNAKLKARAAAKDSKLPALADDSGLEVEALGGAPGIYSARWAGREKDFSLAMRRVAQEVEARTDWQTPPRANFTCVLALAWPDGACDVYEGKVFGHLVRQPRGLRGFGYDPMFVPDGYDHTFGEMDAEHKHAISHRAKAFEKFVAAVLR